MIRPPSGCRRTAFTLLELLVAITVLSVLLLILLSMVDGASRLWRDSENRVDSYREARAAFNTIAADLKSIHPSIEEKFFDWRTSRSDIEDLVSGPAPDGIANSLFFVTAKPDSAQEQGSEGDLCAVGYFLAWGNTSTGASATGSYNLYRYFISSDDTFENISTGQSTPFFTDGTVATPLPSKTVEVLARNIAAFIVTPKTVTSGPALTEFDQSSSQPMPNVVEIKIVAVNQDTADRWGDDKAIWQDATTPTYLENARTFVIRVDLPVAQSANAAAAASVAP